jgi:hypothetical protein
MRMTHAVAASRLRTSGLEFGGTQGLRRRGRDGRRPRVRWGRRALPHPARSAGRAAGDLPLALGIDATSEGSLAEPTNQELRAKAATTPRAFYRGTGGALVGAASVVPGAIGMSAGFAGVLADAINRMARMLEP